MPEVLQYSKEVLLEHTSTVLNIIRRYRTAILSEQNHDNALYLLGRAEELAEIAAKNEHSFSSNTGLEKSVEEIVAYSESDNIGNYGVTAAFLTDEDDSDIPASTNYNSFSPPNAIQKELLENDFIRIFLKVSNRGCVDFETLTDPETVIVAPLSTGLLELHQYRQGLIRTGDLVPDDDIDLKIKAIATAKYEENSRGVVDFDAISDYKRVVFWMTI